MPGFVHIGDDDQSFRTAIGRRLKKAGYGVETYACAQQLLDHLPTGDKPSCIILDVRMPGVAGPALQKRLSDLGSPLPIIFLTGVPNIPATVQAIKAGADDFLTKPVNSDDLLLAIERACARHQTLRGLKEKMDDTRARLGRLTPTTMLGLTRLPAALSDRISPRRKVRSPDSVTRDAVTCDG